MATFTGWREDIDEDGNEVRVQAFPSQRLLWVLCSVLVASSLLALVSSLWQHIAAITAATTTESLVYGFVKSWVGAVAIGLGWAVLGTSIIALVLAVVMAVTFALLDDLTN